MSFICYSNICVLYQHLHVALIITCSRIYMCMNVSVCVFHYSLLAGSEVTGGSYSDSLKEFTYICTLCNDSGLAYNEVSYVCEMLCNDDAIREFPTSTYRTRKPTRRLESRQK